MSDKEFNDFWGEIISTYSDADAQDDGVLIDISNLSVLFNGKVINRITDGANFYFRLNEKGAETAKTDLQFVADNSEKDREGAGAWGIYKPKQDFRNVKFWLVGNEVGGYTLMLPSEY